MTRLIVFQINIDRSIHTHVYNHGATNTSEKMNSPNEAGPSSSLAKVLTKSAPNPSALFQGRRSELEELKKHYELPRGANIARSRHSLLVYGMGGMGKTQLCRKFTEETSDQ